MSNKVDYMRNGEYSNPNTSGKSTLRVGSPYLPALVSSSRISSLMRDSARSVTGSFPIARLRTSSAVSVKKEYLLSAALRLEASSHRKESSSRIEFQHGATAR